MKLTHIRAIPFVLPYRRPFEMATGVITEAAHVLVEVSADEGLSGYAEAVARPMIYGESQASILSAVEQWFGPALTGADPFAVETNQAKLDAVVGNNTAKGAVDIALTDLRAKALELPVSKLVGQQADSLRVTRMLSMGSPAQVAEEVAEARERWGISAFKVKIDADVGKAVQVLGAVREAAGSSAFLYIDANQSLSIADALRLVGACAELRLELLEEPIAATDLFGRARIAQASPAPVAIDESGRTLGDVGLHLLHGSAGAVSIKPARTGFTVSKKIAAVAEALNRRAFIGSQGDSALGTITSAALGASLAITAREPAELDFFLGLGDQIVAEPPTITDGHIHIDTSSPGTGAVIDEDKLGFYRTDV